MNAIYQQQLLAQAHSYWENKQGLDTGKLIFETIPIALRHQWAYQILKLASSRYASDSRVETVLEFAQFPERWGYGKESRYREAHRLVANVNQDNSLLLQLAAQAGKIVYTAQQFPAPFDHGAGWEIAAFLRLMVDELTDPDFEKQAWDTLANSDLMLLDTSVMCHPGCPTCTMNGLTPFSQ